MGLFKMLIADHLSKSGLHNLHISHIYIGDRGLQAAVLCYGTPPNIYYRQHNHLQTV